MRRALRSTLAFAASALLLAACDDRSNNQSVGQQLDAAIARTEKAGSETLAKTREFATAARDEVRSSELKEKLKTTGASISSTVEDVAITARIHALLMNDADAKALDIDVETHRGHVTLRGNAPTATVRERVERLASSVSGVVKVDNELQIGNS